MKIALYHSNRDNVPKSVEVTWGQLAEILTQHQLTPCAPCAGHSCVHKFGRAWSPVDIAPCPDRCRKHGQKSDCGGGRDHRDNKNVRAVTAFVLDFDGLTAEQTRATLTRFQGYAHAVYTTHSHAQLQLQQRFAFRVAVRLTRPVLAEEWVGFRARAVEFFRVGVEEDEACKEPARLYFLPTAPAGSAPSSGAEEGKDLDVDLVLSLAGPAAPPPKPHVDVPEVQTGEVDLDEIRKRLKQVRREESRDLAQDILTGKPLGYSPAQRQSGAPQRPRHVGMLRCASLVAWCAPAGTPKQAILEILRPSFNVMDCEPQGRDHCWNLLESLVDHAISQKIESDEREAEEHKALIASAFGPEYTLPPVAPSAPAVEVANASATGPAVPAPAGQALSPSGASDLGDLISQLVEVQHPPFVGNQGNQESEDWTTQLVWKVDKDGNPSGLKNCLANASAVLRMDKAWRGLIKRNTFSGQTELWGGPTLKVPGPVALNDEHVTKIALWMQQRADAKLRFEISTPQLFEVVNAVAADNEYNPLFDYVDGLKWDGVPRLDTWLERYMGARTVDASGDDVTQYVRTVASKWLIAAIARVYEPGCKVQNVLILEGNQDLKKSSALEVLASRAFFTDAALDIGSKDTSIMTTRTWIVELAELDAFRKSEHTQAKAFFTRDWEEYRPPYGRTVVKRPRVCIFAGTSNKDDYLTDPTGNRRYWPVTCTKVDLAGLREARDQIWAEAKARYQAGRASNEDCLWWLNDDEKELAKSAAEERLASDDWEDPILRWWAQIGGRTSDVRMSAVLEVALGIPKERASAAAQSRAGACLKKLGFTRKRKREGGRLVWYYEPGAALAQTQAPVSVGGQGHLNLLEGGA